MTAVIQSVQFDAPLANPASIGLYPAVRWSDTEEPVRWLAEGVTVRPHNYGGDDAVGVWAADWCATPDDLSSGDVKTGVRPAIPDPFEPITVWAYDQCDLTGRSQDEVLDRVRQNLRLREQVAVEREFASRLKTDTSPAGADNLVQAVSLLESELAKTNTLGVIHASAGLASVAAYAQLVVRSGGAVKTPMGHRWAFGGGYVDALDTLLVATGPVFGWRSEVAVKEAPKPSRNVFSVVAERSVVVGYERAVAAVELGAETASQAYPGPDLYPGSSTHPGKGN